MQRERGERESRERVQREGVGERERAEREGGREREGWREREGEREREREQREREGEREREEQYLSVQKWVGDCATQISITFFHSALHPVVCGYCPGQRGEVGSAREMDCSESHHPPLSTAVQFTLTSDYCLYQNTFTVAPPRWPSG